MMRHHQKMHEIQIIFLSFSSTFHPISFDCSCMGVMLGVFYSCFWSVAFCEISLIFCFQEESTSAEISILRRENEELRALLSKFEHSMDEVKFQFFLSYFPTDSERIIPRSFYIIFQIKSSIESNYWLDF